MRHLTRTHKVDAAWLHERFVSEDYELRYEKSEAMAADIFTKAFNDKDKWAHACQLINVVDPKTFWNGPAADGGTVATSLRAPPP